MNYTTKTLIENMCLDESRRQKAVYLAGRIKKANVSLGFSWKKAIEGFLNQFKKETRETNDQIKKEYPESLPEQINWVHIIMHFADQPYKKE